MPSSKSNTSVNSSNKSQFNDETENGRDDPMMGIADYFAYHSKFDLYHCEYQCKANLLLLSNITNISLFLCFILVCATELEEKYGPIRKRSTSDKRAAYLFIKEKIVKTDFNQSDSLLKLLGFCDDDDSVIFSNCDIRHN